MRWDIRSVRNAYFETRHVSWDAYVDVRGNRYSVADAFAGQVLPIRITLEGELLVYNGDQVIVTHRLQDRSTGWVTVPGHQAALLLLGGALASR